MSTTETLNETLEALAQELNLDLSSLSPETHNLGQTNHRYLRDLRTNISNGLKYSNLSRKEALLIVLATSLNMGHRPLSAALTELATQAGTTAEELAEVTAVTSLMGVNNVLYRFRHFAERDYYNNTPAGIKMNIMMNPVLGKEFFELLSLVISAINGCEVCVRSHEESVRHLGSSEARIYDAIRLGAMARGLIVL